VVVGDDVLAVQEACVPIHAKRSFANYEEQIKCFEQMRLVTGFTSTNRNAENCLMVDTVAFCFKV